MAAILIAAAQQARANPAPAAAASPSELAGEAAVRDILRPLLHQAWRGIQQKQIVFAEAATGTGKGRLIASLAASAARRGGTTVVIAPLSVAYQLVTELRAIQTEVKPLLLLGRANFVDPDKLKGLLDEEDHPAVRKWYENGGHPQAPELKGLSDALHVPLRWLTEDALTMHESLHIADCLLNDDADAQNPAEHAYRAAFEKVAQLQQKGGNPLILCSHLMLAVDSRLKNLHKEGSAGVLPAVIDTLIIDEAHLLEQSFAAVHANTLHLHVLKRHLRDAALSAAARRALENAFDDLSGTVRRLTVGDPVNGKLDDFPKLRPRLRALATQLRETLGKQGAKHALAKVKAARRALGYARQTLDNALSGYSILQLGATPVRKYPLAAVLTSATLYAPDAAGQQSTAHMRWMLGVPKNRACYLAPVIPAWVTQSSDITRMPSELAPDDSDAWLTQTAMQLERVYQSAQGGTLALCTSYATVEAMAQRLAQRYPHLLAQSMSNSASRCAQQFRQQFASGIKPLWLGVGNAWTGIDMADKQAPAEQDLLMTDLYIPRLPYGCNRTLTHRRRVAALGFMVEVHETARLLKQGVGRLVRREGLRHRHIWLADSRLTQPTPHLKPILKLLSAFRQRTFR